MKDFPILTSLFIVLAFGLSNCTAPQEELWIEADGSGRYTSTVDLSVMYPFLLMEIVQEDEVAEDQDPFTAMIGQMLVQQLKAESADTTFSFGDMTAKKLEAEGKSLEMMIDSLENLDPEAAGMTAEEQAQNLQMLKTMKFRLQADRSENMLKFTTISDFEDPAEMGNGAYFIMDRMGGMQGGAQEEPIEQMTQGQTQVDLQGGKLRITRKGTDPTTDPTEGTSDEDKAQIRIMEMMEMMQGMTGDQPYRLTIHFPGKVKKVKSEYAERADRETVVIEIPQEKLTDEDFEFDLTVKFKGMK